MKRIINGCAINLVTLTPDELQGLIIASFGRITQIQNELGLLQSEWYRRNAVFDDRFERG